MMAHDPFGRSSMPPAFDREGRVRLIGEVADALLEGRLPSPAARLFVAGALAAWLRDGSRVGSLEKDFLRTAQRERSRLSVQVLHARCARTATHGEDFDTMQTSTTERGSSE